MFFDRKSKKQAALEILSDDREQADEPEEEIEETETRTGGLGITKYFLYFFVASIPVWFFFQFVFVSFTMNANPFDGFWNWAMGLPIEGKVAVLIFIACVIGALTSKE